MTYKEIRELTEWLERSSFTTYSLTINGVSLSVSKQQAIASPPAFVPQTPIVESPSIAQTSSVSSLNTIEGHLIHSPIVGTYYESANPESSPFVKVGKSVKKGDVLCILEAMKVMNEITCDVDGTIAEIFVSNGSMVEARMPLFKIEV